MTSAFRRSENYLRAKIGECRSTERQLKFGARRTLPALIGPSREDGFHDQRAQFFVQGFRRREQLTFLSDCD